MLIELIWVIVAASVFMSLFWYSVLDKDDVDVEGYPEPSRFPSISVLLPAYNEEETLRESIESVLDQDYPDDRVQPIVIDDGSEDRTAEIAQEFVDQGEATLLQQHNQGKGVALNTGLEEASGDIVAVQDADSVIAPDAYRKMVGHFEQDSIAAVIAGIKPLDCETLLQKVQRVEYLLGIVYRRLMASINTLYVTPGALSMYRRETIEDLGGFDEETLTEDLEIAMRLRHRGYDLGMSATAITFTEFPRRFMELMRQRVRWYRGLISNTWKYREMMTRDDRKLFGSFQMPANLLFPTIGLTAAGIMAYGIGQVLFDLLVHLSVVGLDISLVPSQLQPQKLVLGLDLKIYFPLLVGLVLSGGLVYISHRVTDERIQNPLSLAVFFICYAMILSIFWSIALVKELRGSELTW